MLTVSDDFKHFAQRCVRHPLNNVTLKFNRDEDNYANMESVKCDVTRVEWTSQADSPVASVVKSYADVTLSNTNGEYYQYLDSTLENCSGDIVETAVTKDVRPGLKMRLYEGFSWPTVDSCSICTHDNEYSLQFTGRSEKFPSYTTENGGNSLASIHFVDNIDDVLATYTKFPKDYTGQTVGGALLDWFNTNTPYTITIPDVGAIPLGPLVITDQPLGEYIKYMIELNGGRFYQAADGQYRYETQAYINSQSPTPAMILNTCDHIIDTSTPSLDQIYNSVTVQQFTNPGGVTYTATDFDSITKYGLRPLVVTNPLVDTVDKAKVIADRVISFYSQGTYDREITTVGLGWLEVYDKVLVRERIKNSACSSCGCQTLYSDVIYRITKVYSVHDENGFVQKYTLTRAPLILNAFTFCESETCNQQVGIVC